MVARAQVLVVLLAVVGLQGCAQYSRVVQRSRTADLAVTAQQRELVSELDRLRDKPLLRLGGYLDAAHEAKVRLAANPNDVLALSDYNFAVARVVETISKDRLTPWDTPLVCPSAEGTPWRLGFRAPDDRPEFHPSLFELEPTDRLAITGKLVGQAGRTTGLGASVVAIGRGMDYRQVDPFVMGRHIYHGLTAVVEFQGRRATVQLVDPLEVDSVRLDGRRHELAADFQAPLAMTLASFDAKGVERGGMFRPQAFQESARLARAERYNPRKIPVLFIHGLGNSPATWAPVVQFLRSDPTIRRNYQFWFFGYPTGQPYPMAAATLRTQLDALRKRYPDHKDIVVIGHSMGGMISRLLITDSGSKIWDNFFAVPPKEIPMSDAARELMERSLIFRARPDISRVIFVSASHRGSDMATAVIGRMGARLVGNPIAENVLNREVYSFVRPELRAKGRHRLPNSIELLDPRNQFLAVVDSLPLKPGVPFHSIIGDRGRGGRLDRGHPTSNDGIVPYWSSHMTGAQSETIIPSGHWSHLHPLGMVEIKRILLEHLKKS